MDSKQSPDQPPSYHQEPVKQSLPVSASPGESYELQRTLPTPPPYAVGVPYPGAEPLPVVTQPGQQIRQNTLVNQVVAPATTVFVAPAAVRPNSYIGLSIFSCLCCCWPIGLAAIIYSTMVDSSYNAGDFDGASRNSKIARQLNIISIILGIGLLILIILISQR